MPLNPLKIAVRVVDMTLGLAGRVIGSITGRQPEPEPPRQPVAPPQPAAAPPPATAPPPAAAAAAAVPPEPEREPEPVAEEDELVATSSDTDADVGADVHVAEPWPNYDAMKAADVIDRLVVADAATLAAVQLYEQRHRGRRTVIEQARRRLAAPAART